MSVYEDMKDYHNAMIFHQLYTQYSDSVYTSEMPNKWLKCKQNTMLRKRFRFLKTKQN